MTVCTKARVILPTVQVVIAAALVVSNSRRPDTMAYWRSTHLDIQYCWALNSPAAMIAHIQREATYELLQWHYPINRIIDWGIFLSLVWLLWYAVSIETGGKGLSVLTPKTGIRRVADVLAIAFGACLVVYADFVTRSVYHQTRISSVHLIWVLAIVGFYGHDLWASFRTKRTISAGRTPAA
jgi:hypothetical protein